MINRALNSILLASTLLSSSFALTATTFEEGFNAASKGNYSQAIKIWTPLAEQNNLLAQSNLGVLYENGWGVSKDYKKALYWYEKAAEKGQSEAQHNLASLFQQGHGTKQDLNTAAYWYEKAAEQNYGDSQLMLGLMYIEIEEYELAAYWYRQAVNNNVEGAQKNLDYVCKLKPQLLTAYC